jgi:uncharacterized membrane protein
MSSKTNHLVVAYFATAEAAEDTASFVKEWDKNIIEIDLGAIGILTMDDDGKVKTKKVGDHAAGKGAKWGLVAGAVTGIFTGGLTLIGGALAGLAIGAVAGAMFHRGLGMTDGQKEDLETHLKNGGAALVIVTPPEQVAPLESVLATRSDSVSVFEMDEETAADLDAVSETKGEEEVAAADTAEEAETAADSDDEAEPAAEADEKAEAAANSDEEAKPTAESDGDTKAAE